MKSLRENYRSENAIAGCLREVVSEFRNMWRPGGSFPKRTFRTMRFSWSRLSWIIADTIFDNNLVFLISCQLVHHEVCFSDEPKRCRFSPNILGQNLKIVSKHIALTFQASSPIIGGPPIVCFISDVSFRRSPSLFWFRWISVRVVSINLALLQSERCNLKIKNALNSYIYFLNNFYIH